MSFIVLVGSAYCQDDESLKHGPSAFYGRGEVNNIFKTRLSSTSKDDITLEMSHKGTYSERTKARRAQRNVKLNQPNSLNPSDQNPNNSFAVQKKQQSDWLGQSSPFAARQKTQQQNMLTQPKVEALTAKGQMGKLSQKKEEEVPENVKIIEKFGDPTAKPKILVDDNAPQAYKAAAAALDAGDEKLAYQYVQKYVREKSEFFSAVDMVVRMEAFHNDRMRGLSLNELAEKYPDLRNSALAVEFEKEQKQQEEEQAYESRLSDEALKIIEGMKESSYDMFSKNRASNSISKNLNEKDARAQARSHLQGRRIPHAPAGKVEIFAFVRLNDSNVQAIAGDLEQLYQKAKKSNGLVNIAILTDNNFDEYQLKKFRTKTKTTFPVTSGVTLAKAMGVVSVPSLVFVAAQTGERHTEKGLRNFYYYDELLKVMQGQ